MSKIPYKAKSGRTLYKQSMTESKYSNDSENGIGYCLACGKSQDCCEPDARKYKCHSCGEEKVYGLEEMMLMGLIILK
jgi:hypothetical protein